ncbi:helix-turn-helix transcriptional regulator [Paraburkholderia sp.]|uniref:helix-turn-helix transcriptional regulator n=1 Tax=Paraburkholderia sp. TaxID=1926495 RepID=UPI00239ED93C|nr:helix-turn-helix transcriptional regulator [Paraburkholderia sp.]MDE1182611.1 helix-turn-helix transcriptional regulator [Paraburkholderia sp.]
MQVTDLSNQTFRTGGMPLAASHTIARIIDSIADADFARTALESLDATIGAGSWSVYQRFSDAPPQLHLSASHGIPDTTRDCFRIYRAGLYQRDATFECLDTSAQSTAGRALVARVRASEIGPREHREQIYESHGMVDRMSVLSFDGTGGVLAVNLYRHLHQGCYSAADYRAFQCMAAPVMAAVRRHVKLTTHLTPGAALTADSAADERFASWLVQYCPALSSREVEVCERLLRGMSYDGIAADLGIGLSTVKTYRLRAFERLGIHFRNELFSLFVAGR